MEISEVIAQNLKRLRTERSMSLGELSEKSGLSKTMLAQIERGDSNPTVNTLCKIITGLGVSYSALMTPYAPEVSVVRSNVVAVQADDDGAYRLGCYFPTASNRDFEIYRNFLDAGAQHETDGQGENAEEFIYLISGELTMVVGGSSYTLQPGDAIHFDASLRHIYRNTGSSTVDMIIVNYYPIR